MKKLLLLVLIAISCNINAQELKTHNVPKKLSFDVGVQRLYKVNNMDSIARFGYSATFDYAYQLSGFSGKRATYLTIPIGYSYLPSSNASEKTIKMLRYGWTVRHDMSVGKKLTPFLGYSLLLTSLKKEDIEGGIMGHQTKFEFGVDFNNFGKNKPYFKVEYTYTRFPRWDVKESYHFQLWELKIGYRISKKAKVN